MKMQNTAALSLTPRFSGVSPATRSGKPFQRFPRAVETVETVSRFTQFAFTPLKRGVKESRWGAIQAVSTSSLLLLLGSSVFVGAVEPLDIGNRRQLFIDAKFIASSNNVRLVVHQPRKTGERSIDTDRPWERGGLGPYSCVLKDGDTYVMWYHAMDSKQWDGGHTNGSICYATSRDGITWTKPNLGLVAYNGSQDNNIVVGHGAAGIILGQDGMMVFLDPNAPTSERFRMVNRFGHRRDDADTHYINLLSSGDGIHWKLTHEDIIKYRPEVKGHHLDSQNVLFWDEGRKKYVAYVRRNIKGVQPQGRGIARAESDRLGDFPVVQDMPFMLQPDAPDAWHGEMPVVDYYSSAALRYPWADDAYFMFPQAYYHYTRALRDFGKANPVNAGALDTQFAASRDGINWERYDRQPFIPVGMRGEFDPYSARVIYGLVPDVSGREMFMYYRASDWLHGWDRNDNNKKILTDAGLGATQDVAVISRVVLRRDGFVSVTGDYRGGEFTTPPLKFSGQSLKLNINTTATGRARVAILDAADEPIPGFALDDCDIIHTANEINHTVKWKRQTDVSSLAGKPVRLHVSLRNTELYAFQFQ